jgi:thiol-disulfide isomerase/thioredoxin
MKPIALAGALTMFALLPAAPVTLAAGGGKGMTAMSDRPPAPELDMRDLDGLHHTLAGHRGKVLIVNFWATWCPPCREEMPSMERAWQAVKDEGIVLLAINVGETEEQIGNFTGKYPVTFPLLLDEDASGTQRWPVQGLPTTYVVDAEGRLAFRAIGGRDWDDPALLDQVRALRPPAVAARD